jgi:serine/threonine-protein kinase
MGSVWEGVHASLGNRVACKFIEPEHLGSADAVSRFENEARAAASLRSKHVVDVYDHGVMPDGRPYIVMEFLEGEPLDARISRLGSLNLQETSTIILQVSRALSQAHKTGIVHRDLKPENIFLVWDDEDQTDIVKVVDFGIAKFTDSEASGISSATKTGSILGTPYYMSPEQARGLKNLDARSDNWSLGVIAYEALTGTRPFTGEAVGDILVKICTDDPVPASSINPNLNEDLDEWMKKALGRDPGSRFQDVREMAENLLTLAGLPGRGTFGSAMGSMAETAAAGVPPARVDGTTVKQGSSPKATTGAVTHAAVGGDTVLHSEGKKLSPIVYIGAAAAALSLIGVGLALSGGPGGEVPAATDQAEELEADPPQPEPTPSDKKSAEKAVDEEPHGKEDEPAPTAAEDKPPAAAPAPAPRPAARPASPRPKPAPAPRPAAAPKPAPAPRPAVAPKPAPAPKPAADGLDLGY